MLTEHQQEVFNQIIPEIETIVKSGGQWDTTVSLIGAAGVGKTYMTTEIIKALLQNKVKVTITTPTHKALKVVKNMLQKEGIVIDSKTIHSFLNLKLKPNYENGLQELIMDDFNKNNTRTDVLIVDESSMICKEMFNYIQTAIRYRRAKCVLFVGDYFQLPPVTGELNPVFEMKSQYQLTEIVRQAAGNPIIQLATDIRQRIESQEHTNLRHLVSKYTSDKIRVVSDGKEFMSMFLTANDETSKWFEKDQIIASFTNESVDNYNRALRLKYWKDHGYNTDDIPYLMVGDTIIFQEAHIEGDNIIHANNDIVTVTTAKKLLDEETYCWYWECTDEENLGFRILDPISKQKYAKYLSNIASMANLAKGVDKKNLWEKYYSMKGQYQDIKYSFASTVHKLQGSTFEEAFVDLRGILQYLNETNYDFIYRLVYVAVTRASDRVTILI